MSHLVDSDTAMRIGLRNRLDELAEERQRLLSQLMYIERTIKETLDAVNMAEGRR